MELKYKKLSLFCLSTIFSVASALAATENISTITLPDESLKPHSLNDKNILRPVDASFKAIASQKKSVDINKKQKVSKRLNVNPTSALQSVTASTNSATVNSWTNIVTVGNRTFSGVKTLGGVYDPAISGDGNIVTIREGVNGKLVNINYSNPFSPYVTDITPSNMFPPYDDTAYPMAISAYLDSDGQYRSGMWDPLVKPGIVKVNPSGNAWNNTLKLYTSFPAAGHTHDIDRYGNKMAIMRRANDGSGYKHNIYSVDASTVFNGGGYSSKLLSNSYNQEFVNASSNSQYPKISGSGQFIAYESNSYDIVPNDTNYVRDIFVVNTTTQKNAANRNVRINLASDGTQANGSSSSPDISDDGRLVVYSTTATNLVAEGVGGIILHDRLYNTNTLISVNASGIPATSYGNPSMSYDGRFIAFESSDNNLTTDNVTGNNAYVYDVQTGEVRLASYSLADGSYNITASRTNISANGDHLVFLSGEYVYRVENPFEIPEGLVTSVLTDERGDIVRSVTVSEPDFMFPVKLVNSTSSAKTVSIINQLYYFNGTNYTFYADLHPMMCGDIMEQTNTAITCVNSVPTFNVTPNTSNPAYITYDPLPFSKIYSGVQWLSYFIITDESTGEKSYLRMEFLTN